MPSLRVARLGWLPSQAKIPLHDGWYRNRQICQQPSNVKSTIRKAKLPPHKPGSPWENCSLPTTSQLHLFCTTSSLLRTILEPASWWLSQSCDSYAAAFCCRDVGPKWAKQQTQLGRTLVPSCQYNFNSGILASGKTRIPLQDGWRRTWQMCQWPRNVESTIRKAKLPQHKPGSPWENGKLVATYNFAASPFLHCMISTLVAVPKLRFLRSCFLCREHSLEEHLWHVASTTSTVASLRVARLGWLPSQAKRHRTAKLWHWSWNVKSTIS